MIFSLQLIIIFIVIQIQEENFKIKEFLKNHGYRENMSIFEKIIGKKGMLDARILLFLAILFLLYLAYKAFISN